MSKKEIALVAVIALIVVAGPAYILFGRDSHNSTEPQPAAPVSVETKPQDEQPAPVSFDKTKYSYTDPTSIWVVANKQNPLNPKTYVPADLQAVGGGQQLRAESATALASLIAGAKQQGLVINPLSGYRSYTTQVSVYNNEVKSYGQAVADSESARPGYSEHQTGLAIDVGGGGCGIEDCFGTTPSGKWLAANAYTYGFIIRYPENKQAVTGYRYEPWHIRYVGTELAAEMQKQGVLTLEEFFGLPAAASY